MPLPLQDTSRFFPQKNSSSNIMFQPGFNSYAYHKRKARDTTSKGYLEASVYHQAKDRISVDTRTASGQRQRLEETTYASNTNVTAYPRDD